MRTKTSLTIEDIKNIPSDLLRGSNGLKGLIYLSLLSWVVTDYITNVFYKPDFEQYKVLFSAIGLCSTFAALSFSGSAATTEKTKEHLRNSGIKLFVAALHITKALILRYAFDILRKTEFWESLRLMNFITNHLYIQRTLLTLLYVAACIFMALSVNMIVDAYHQLNRAFKLSPS